MYQFFVDDCQIGKEYVTITGSDVNHIKNVLRMRPGEKIRVSSSSRDMFCEIAELTDDFVQADILDEEAPDTELPSRIYLFQGLPKGDRMEYIIQKSVELGVYEIIPVAMKYCVVKLDAKKAVVRLDEKKAQSKVKRWQAISESAAKQAKRSRIPEVHAVMNFKDAVEYAKLQDMILVPYENERGMEATREALKKVKPGQSISVFIGPEGGFSEEEIDALRQDAEVLSLGKRILRTDTAAICAMSMLMLELEEKTEGEC